MKVAVAATKDDISADVSYYGGRAPFYLIFDEQGELRESLSNPFVEMDRHAGYEVANMMAERGVDIMVAGLIGPTMMKELSGHGIKCVIKSGPARDVVLQLDL